MNQYNNGFLKRISKLKAKQAYENGTTVYMCPVNLTLNNWSYNRFGYNNNHNENSFQSLVNEFTYYNCNTIETGKYPAYYINSEHK